MIRTIALVVMAGLLAAPAMALDKEQTAQARKVFDANKNAVVFLSGVAQVEMSAGGQTMEREVNFQAIGSVINKSGMVVTTLSSIGTSGTQSMGGQTISIKVKKHDQVKIVLDDGTEVPADVVLKDADLDLAFITPRKDTEEYKSAKWTSITLAKAAKVEVLDSVITIARMGKSFNLEPVVGSSEISGIVTKPRKFYIGPSRQSCPVFNLEGQAIGITIVYKAPGDEASRTIAILPADDVLKIAEQAKTAKPATEPTTTSAPTATTAPATTQRLAPTKAPTTMPKKD